MHVTPALGMAAICLVGMVATLRNTFGRDRTAEAYARRVDTVLGPRGATIGAEARSLRKASAAIGFSGRVFRFLGCDPEGAPIRPDTAAKVAVAMLFATMMLGWLQTFVLGRLSLLDVPILWAVACRALFRWLIDRHTARLRSQMPDALDMIVRNVRVGIPVFEGFRAVGAEAPEPTGTLFRSIAGEVAIGIPVDQALLDVSERTELQEYRFLATALSLQGRTGGGLTETLENLADIIRKRMSARERGYALAAEARTSALVLGCLPLLALGGLLLMNPAYILLLFHDRFGHKILFAALVSQSSGIAVMRTMIRRSLS